MTQTQAERLTTGVLVIGGGGAGMRAALAAADAGAQVVVAVKGLAARSGATPMAGSAVQAVFDPEDSAQSAAEDMSRAGKGLGDENLVRALVEDAPQRVRDLAGWGVVFVTNKDGSFTQLAIPGQSHKRNTIIKGSGYGLCVGLQREIKQREKIRLQDDWLVTRLFTHNEQITGALVMDMRRGCLIVVQAAAVVLATGGYQNLWHYNDAEPGLTGDGVFLAFEAGADLIDLEMMQYYPTVLCHPVQGLGVCISYENLLNQEGCAGKMVNGCGETFFDAADLPTRDRLSRLIFTEIDAGRVASHGGVLIDLTTSPHDSDKLKQMLAAEGEEAPMRYLMNLGINGYQEPLEVRPFTHFTMGGVRIDEWGQTTVQGLFAAGEVSGNLHGANRIGGNALAETQVFGARAGERAGLAAAQSGELSIDPAAIAAEVGRLEGFLGEKKNALRPLVLKRKIRDLMDTYVGHRRSAEGLERAIESLRQMRVEDLPRLCHAAESPRRVFNYEWQEALEVEGMLQLAELIAAAALQRCESRGSHWRLDYPESDPAWEKHTLICKTAEEVGYHVNEAAVIRL